jgi:CheY-like chemotaxis protein
LRQILTNLIGNAIKFTEKGEITIEVQRSTFNVQRSLPSPLTLNLEPGTVNLYFAVRDTGIGIPREARSRIFESFSQADGSTARKYGGTGLGLSIAKQLTQLMGGQIGVESEVGKGSTFWFTVWLEPSLLNEKDQALSRCELPAPRVAIAEEAELRFSASVLLVEDNPVNQQVTRSMLEMFGCRVEVAANGRAALAAFSRTVYDLVLMDCQMPEMDGFAATKEIRRRESQLFVLNGQLSARQEFLSGTQLATGHWPLTTAHVPIIALTANAMSGDRERCLAAGMDDYVSKPLTRFQLGELLQRWLPQQGTFSERQGNGQPLDYGALDDIRALQTENTPSVLDAVIRSYLSSAPRLLQTLHEAVARADAVGVRQAAHTLKSSSASLGALTLAGLCKKLEEMGRGNSIVNADQALTALTAEYTLVHKALTAELHRSSQ